MCVCVCVCVQDAPFSVMDPLTSLLLSYSPTHPHPLYSHPNPPPLISLPPWLLGRPLQAEKVDAALHSLLMKLEPQRQHLACLGTWILYHNLRIMIHYLLSGFELELYSMHEYYYIYW